MNERIDELRTAGEAAIAEAPDTAELEEVRVRFLGRKAELPNLLRGVAQLPPEQRGQVGRAANEARRALEAAIEARRAELEAAELDARLAADVVDVTLPGSPEQRPGRHHLLTATWRSSTRSRGWPWTRTSRSPTSRARCSPSRARSSATSARSACGRTSSPS